MNFNILGDFQKKYIFLGNEILWIFRGGGGHHKIGLYLGVISMRFMVFSKGQDTKWGIFSGVAIISNTFGVLEILDMFGRER